MPAAPFLLVFLACKAVDGDTIRCGRERVRLVRIDTPERGEPGFDEATEAMRLMVEGKEVRCVMKPYRDRYGRLLGDCGTDEVPSLSDAMLDAGLAGRYR